MHGTGHDHTLCNVSAGTDDDLKWLICQDRVCPFFSGAGISILKIGATPCRIDWIPLNGIVDCSCRLLTL